MPPAPGGAGGPKATTRPKGQKAAADGEVAPLQEPVGPDRPQKRRVRIVDDADVGILRSEAPVDRSIRVILVEDLPDVANHMRELLGAQHAIRLVKVVQQGRSVANDVRDLRPDVVVVDSLLQGRVSGATVVERLRRAGSKIGIVMIDVRDKPVEGPTLKLVDTILRMPFNGFGLAGAIHGAAAAGEARDPALTSRVVAVYAAKGGVGKTTIAYNMAVALAGSGVRTALIDGSLQYGDLRRHLRLGPEVPSICDLPIESRRQSDLSVTMFRDPSGVHILLAPPRLEMADLVTVHDLEEIVDIARRSYQAIVIDTTCALNETTLALLDLSDVILQVLTPEPAALDSTRAAADAFAAIGYPAAKVRTVINRADTSGGLSLAQLSRALGRVPDHVIASDWALASSSSREGIPFVVARPDAQMSRDVRALAAQVSDVLVDARPARRPARIRR